MFRRFRSLIFVLCVAGLCVPVASAQTTFLTAANSVRGYLNTTIDSSTTSIVLQSGEGAEFPSTYPYHVVVDAEIMEVTNKSTDTLTVTRAQESTTASGHVIGSKVQMNVTAEYLTEVQAAINVIEGIVYGGAVTLGDDKTIAFGDDDDFRAQFVSSTGKLVLGDGTNWPITITDNGTTFTIESSPDTDTTHRFGRISMGGTPSSGGADVAYMAHHDMYSGFNAGWFQTAAGATALNAATGQVVTLRINNATEATIDTGGVDLASGNTYEINGTQISSANLSNDAALVKSDGSVRMRLESVTDAGPMTATNGTAGDVVFNTSDSKAYVCTVTGTPGTWSVLN